MRPPIMGSEFRVERASSTPNLTKHRNTRLTPSSPRNTRLTPSSPRDRRKRVGPSQATEGMPFAIQQANSGNLTIIGLAMTTLFLLFTAGNRRAGVVITAIAISFWILALLAAFVPFNVFHAVGGPRSRAGGYPKIPDLTVPQRRLLVALYDPRNRRSAAVAVLLMSLTWLAAWFLSALVVKRPLAPEAFRANEFVAVLIAVSLPYAAWTALFGLSRDIRRNWSEIISAGPAWPTDVEYPGPWKEAVRSVITGRLPEFISQPPPLEPNSGA